MNPKDVKILIVDDDPEILEVLQDTFESFGYKVTVAKDGNEALFKIQAQEFKLVLTDLHMPNLSGQQLIKTLKIKNPKSPQVLALSGYSDSTIEELFNLGCDGFFSKPFNAVNIREAIQKSLVNKKILWNALPNMVSEISITKQFESFNELESSGEVRFGRSGLFLSHETQQFYPGETVAFKITITSQEPWGELSGNGKVYWVRHSSSKEFKRGAGIEIVNIKPENLSSFCKWLDSKELIASIPK